MEDPIKKIYIENILKEDPDATVGDFRNGRYMPKDKKSVQKSPDIQAEEIRLIDLLKKDLEKEIHEHEKLLGISYESIPGVMNVQKELSMKTEKIHAIDTLIKELEAQYADLDTNEDEIDRKYKGLAVEILILKILKEAKDIRFSDEKAQNKFEDLQSMLDMSVTNYFAYKKEKDALEKASTNPNDSIKEKISLLQSNMNEEQRNKFAAVIELKKIMDIHNIDAN